MQTHKQTLGIEKNRLSNYFQSSSKSKNGTASPNQISEQGQLTTQDRSYERLVILLADNSGSVAGKLAEKINSAILSGMKQLSRKFNRDSFRVALIKFGSSASLEHRAVAPCQVAPNIDGSGWGTRLTPGLVLSVYEIERFESRSERTLVPPIVFLLAEGLPVDVHDALFVTEYLKQRLHAQIFVLAVGEINGKELMSLTSSDEHFVHVAPTQLEASFNELCKKQSAQLRLLFR